MINSGREWDWMDNISSGDEGSKTLVHLSNRSCPNVLKSLYNGTFFLYRLVNRTFKTINPI